jgi:hypothetical protein
VRGKVREGRYKNTPAIFSEFLDFQAKKYNTPTIAKS